MFVPLLLFFVATFATVSAGLVGYRFFLERRELFQRPGDGGEAQVAWVEPADLLKSDALSTISVWHRLLKRFDCFERMRQRLAESGLNWSVGRLTALMLLTGAVVFALLIRWSWVTGWMALGVAIGTGVLPYAHVLRIRSKRLEKFESQFADALDSLARALRAGNPLVAGLDILAREAPNPLGYEMRVTANERQLGSNWDQALDNLAERVPLVEVSIFVAAVKLQNRAGGNLSEMLGRLSESMRSTHALKSEVRSIAAHGRMTGTLLTILPLGIALMMSTVNPAYLEILWNNPTGKDLVTAAALALVAAHLVIRRMVDIRI